MEKARMLGMEGAVAGGTEGGRSPTGVPPTTTPAVALADNGSSYTVTISNVGASNLSVTGITTTGTDSAMFKSSAAA